MKTLTKEDICVLAKGLVLADLWLRVAVPVLVDDCKPGTVERWTEEYSDFAALVDKLTTTTPESTDAPQATCVEKFPTIDQFEATCREHYCD